MIRRFTLLFIWVISIFNIAHANYSEMSPLGGNDDPSTVFFDLNACFSNAGEPGSANDYSEFTAVITNESDCVNLSVLGENLYRINPEVNAHSCAPGVDGSIAMCIGISDNCDYDAGNEAAIRFSIEVAPTENMSATVSQLRFFENAPEEFQWINGPSGINNYPTLYAIRILVDGTTVYEESDIPTEQGWNEEIFNFSNIPDFIVSETTVFDFELLPYCPIGAESDVAAWDVDNITLIAGCDPVDGGEISANGNDELEICIGDGIDDNIDVTLIGNIGANSQWIIADSDGIILDLPTSPPFNFEDAENGICVIWHLSFATGLSGLESGSNIEELVGCFDLSNPITVIRNGVAGGQLSLADGTNEIELCVGGGNSNPLEVVLEDTEGANLSWLITDENGNILELPVSPPFDFDGAEAGVCLIWNIAFSDGLIGLEVGMNSNDFVGCFDLSDSIKVIRSEAAGGILALEDGSDQISICAGDGISDSLSVSLAGNLGDNMSWVITDVDGIILDLPVAPPFDLEGAGAGICLIWNLSYADNLVGLTIGENTADFIGCYDFSNPITVERNEATGGTIDFIEFEGPEITICVGDGLEDSIHVNLIDNHGENSTWIITDTEGNILDLPETPPFNFEGAEAGTCLIWHLSYAEGIIGLEIGLNAFLLEGCYDLSNALTVTRESAEGGTLTFPDESTEINICVGDGDDDLLEVILEGNSGDNTSWIITDIEGNILDLPTEPPFNLEGAGAGVCFIWNISYSDGIEGLEVDSNTVNLLGCYDLSNPLTVNRTEVNGGQLETIDGQTQLTICADDGISDVFDVVLTNVVGTNKSWVITDINGIILDLPNSAPFDLEGSGQGTCLLYNISYEDGLTGLEIGLNINNIIGCADLSNSITITRLVGDNCDIVLCDAEGGMIMYTDSTLSVTICADDGIPDSLDIEVSGNIGTNSSFIITDSDGLILELASNSPVILDGLPAGLCLIWHVASEANFSENEIGNNLIDLDGCYDLSNFLSVTKVVGEDCDNVGCDVEGGVITFDDGTTQAIICADDNLPDLLDVILVNETGTNSGWVITSVNGLIMELPETPPFDFEGSDPGLCLIRHISFDGEVIGLEIGLSINDLGGCFDLSNPIAVNKVTGPACENIGCEVSGGDIATTGGLTEIEFCADDGLPDSLEVNVSNSFGGQMGWILTDVSGTIIGIPGTLPIDFEGTEAGVCLLWHIAYEDGLMGYEIDGNITLLDGCFDLSNQITITKFTGENCQMIGCESEGGTISLENGLNQINICIGDGNDDNIDVNLEDNIGANSQWIITDNSMNILELPSEPPFNFESAEQGICQIWHLSYEEGLVGLGIGLNISEMMGCFSLSNNILIIREAVNGGDLSFEEGGEEIEICVGDGDIDSVYVNLTGELGDSSQWVITDTEGIILGLPLVEPFTFEEAGTGNCLIYNISYNDTISGLEEGLNIADLIGCYEFSNSISVIRNEGDDCDDGIQGPGEESKFTIAPNPVSEYLNIYFEDSANEESRAFIYDNNGKELEVFSGKRGEKVSVYVGDYLSGIYVVRVTSRGDSKIKKFIKLR